MTADTNETVSRFSQEVTFGLIVEGAKEKKRRKPRSKPNAPRTLPAVLQAADAGGWEHSVRTDYNTANEFPPEAIPRTEVHLIRNDEEITIAYWQNVETAEERPTYTIGERHIKLRNVAAAKIQLLVTPEEAEKGRVRKGRGKAKKFDDYEADNRPRKRIPFDLDTASEEEIRSAVAGRRIRWARSNGAYDDAILLKNPKQFKVHTVRTQDDIHKRLMTFCDAKGGFTTIYLDRLVTIGK